MNNKKVVILLSIIFVFGLGFSIFTQKEWALQMLIATALIIIIFVIKKKKKVDENLPELLTALGITLSPNIMNEFLPNLYDFRNFVNHHLQAEWISIEVYRNLSYFSALALMYLLTNMILQDRTTMKKHRGEVLPLFDNEIFKRKRKNFCDALETNLTSINIETQWNADYFVPLEAEVIVEEHNKTKRKSRDLMKALKSKSYENAFLVLGDPGSGKSTILRTLAKDLLKEVDKTNKIPLYINLKDWDVQEKFTEKSPPRLHHLLNFIKKNLEDRLGDIFASDFIAEYFDELYLQGYLYFIFDSFDEIPMLLDEAESSWLVDKISYLISSVCSNKNTKIILSSRFFRQPTNQFQTRIKMQIKPLNDINILECFNRLTNSNRLTLKLLSNHKELMKIASNPFYASLISIYYKEVQSLPQKEAELYDKFINLRLEHCERLFSLLSKHNIDIPEIIRFTQEIAISIFDNDYGIEIPLEILINEKGIPNYVVDILHKAKLIRVGDGVKKSISFSHRRFNEYFVACSLIDQDVVKHRESIPIDSKWRDTLVLYAQICSEDKVNELIKFCCTFFNKIETKAIDKKINEEMDHIYITLFETTITKMLFKELEKTFSSKRSEEVKEKIIMNDSFTNALHSLRFLITAFSSQPKILYDFQKEIMSIINLMLQDENLLYHKIALQAVPILTRDNIEIILNKVLTKNNYWINDEVIRNCSNLDNVEPKIVMKIIDYYTYMNNRDFIQSFSQNFFYLSLSANFKKIRFFCIIKFIHLLLAILVIPILLINAFITTSFDIFLTILSLLGVQLLFTYFLSLTLNFKVASSIKSMNRLIKVIMVFFPFYSALYYQNLHVWLIALLLPTTLGVYYFSLQLKKNYKLLLNKALILELFIGTSVVILPTILFTILLRLLPEFIIDFIAYFVLLFLIIILISGAVGGLIIDSIKFKKIEYFVKVDRQIVTKNLSDFSTSYFQGRYLTALREKNIQAYGEWNDSELPKLKNYKLDRTLSHMEENWLGL